MPQFNNEHIGTAFALLSSLSVSGEIVDLMWAVRQQLLMADKDFAKTEVKNDG